MTIVDQPHDTTDLRHRIDAVLAEINDLIERQADLLERRANLMATTVAEFAAHGIEAHVIRRYYTDRPEVGDRVCVTEEYDLPTWGVWHRFQFRERGHTSYPGPWWRGTRLCITHGTFEILLVDGDDYLLVKVPDVDNDEEGHRKAISRLRNLARHDNLRVSVRDRDVRLIDPMGSTVHEGDVTTAHMWLLNIDPTSAKEDSK